MFVMCFFNRSEVATARWKTTKQTDTVKSLSIEGKEKKSRTSWLTYLSSHQDQPSLEPLRIFSDKVCYILWEHNIILKSQTSLVIFAGVDNRNLFLELNRDKFWSLELRSERWVANTTSYFLTGSSLRMVLPFPFADLLGWRSNWLILSLAQESQN